MLTTEKGRVKVNVRIQPIMYRRLHILCRNRSISMAELLRELVSKFIQDIESNNQRKIQEVLAHIDVKQRRRNMTKTISFYLDDDKYEKLTKIKELFEENLGTELTMSDILRAILEVYTS